MTEHSKIQKWLLALWGCLAGAILVTDFFTGPNVAVSYFYLTPVALAARYSGGFWGIIFAIGLPLARFSFFFIWNNPLPLLDTAINGAIRIIVLVGVAILVDRVTRQSREIRALRGFLPICSFCKKIRTADQNWQTIEKYVSEHSEAKFSHTFCPECGAKHYGDLIGEKCQSTPPPQPVSQ